MNNWKCVNLQIMKMNRLLHLVFCITALSFTSCGDNGDEPEPQPEAAFRTVLVYMAANNNLGSSGYDAMDMAEMREAAKAGDTGDGRLVVYNGGYNKAAVLVEVTAGGFDTLKVYDRTEMSVDASRMSRVFVDVEHLAPADDYGLVLWSHGTGWIRDGIADVADRRRSFGDETVGRNHYRMNTSTLARTIASAPVGFSFLYFDCCYMMSVETLYELRDAVPLIAGSVTELPSEGMPYDSNVRYFFSCPEADIEGAAASTFSHFDAMSGQARTCTMSVVSTAGIGRLAEAVKAVYEACGGGIPHGYTPQLFSWTSLESCRYFDLRDYIHALCDNAGRADLKSAFDSAFDAVVLYSAATPKLWNYVNLERTNGVSTYILADENSADDDGYRDLAWYADIASSIRFDK